MKTKDNTTRLKTYKIKNHDSGKTYRVKAVSYTDAKMKYNEHILKDSLTMRKMIKDGWSAYTFKTGLRSDAFKQYLRDRGIYFESSQDGEYTHFEVKNADEAVDRRANEIARQLKDSITEDAEIAGWIAIYNGTRIEIKKGEADSLYAAKKLAILKFKEKFKHVKEHMIVIAPGYNDSITEDADKAMGTYKGYTIKQNVDGNIYVLKKSGEKEFFESWKAAHTAITSGAIKDSVEDALTNVQSDKLYKLLSKLDKYDLYELAYGGPSRGSIGAPKRDLLDDAFHVLVDKSLQDVNSALREYNLKLDSITEDAYTKYYLRRIRDKYTFSGVRGMWDEEIASYSFKKHENPDVFISIIKKFVDFNMTKSELLSRAPGFVMSFVKDSAKDSITEDADIAQNDIKSSYLPEDANADNIQYLGFNEKRKLSFYSYGDRYFVHYDLEGRTEEIDKETVQKILKKNILGEIDENDLINKEPQAEEIVTDTFDWKERGDR